MQTYTRCIILCSFIEGCIKSIITPGPRDFLLCADGGYNLAMAEGLVPNLVIGDLDSVRPGEILCDVMQLPREKDDTDLMAAIKYALNEQFENIVIVGGLGGRLDHTIASLQALAYGLDHGKRILLKDGFSQVCLIENESLRIARQEGMYLSVFAFSDVCTGVSESGVKYPLSGHTLRSSFPLGVSNEFAAEEALVGVESGRLLVVLAKADRRM